MSNCNGLHYNAQNYTLNTFEHYRVNIELGGVYFRKELTDEVCWVILGYRNGNTFHNLYSYESCVFVVIA